MPIQSRLLLVFALLGVVGCGSAAGASARSAQNNSDLAPLRAEMARLEKRLADALAERDAAQTKAEKCEETVARTGQEGAASSLPVVKMVPPEESRGGGRGAVAPESRLVVRVEGDGEGEIVETTSSAEPVLPPNAGVRLSDDAESNASTRPSPSADSRQKGATKKSRGTSE